MENISESFWGKSLAQHCLENEQKVNMKYKLKRDLPWAKAGTICEVVAQERCLNGSYLMKDTVSQNEFTAPYATFSDWFEEADERREPELNEKFFLVEDDGSIDFYNWYEGSRYNEALYSFGNCFRTRELAEQAAEQIKALLKEFHKNNP